MPTTSPAPSSPVTHALSALRGGDPTALDRLFSLVYPELHQIAHRQLLRLGGDATLNTTALVHELYMKLIGAHAIDARDRGHFIAITARAMRQILVDGARRARAQKRTPVLHVTADSSSDLGARAADLIALDQALDELASLEPRLGRMVELRFFGGLSVEETAAALEISPRTVKRDWRKARAFLHRAIAGGRAA
jgi:RNA polymerase sigma factor (TIGR02999 family)